MDRHDRVALITGASGGLGAVTASLLAGHGVHIAVTHLGHRDEAADLCRQIEAKGRKAFFIVHLDQTDPASCSAAVEATVNPFSRVDILIKMLRGTIQFRFLILIRSRPRSGIEP